MAEFKRIDTKIKDMVLIEPTVFGDERGYFMETYNKETFAEIGLNMTFVQDNQSNSKKGVLRGLHFQTKHAQGKLVRALSGDVFDVGVDLRAGSPTYGMWDGYILSAENKRMLYIPEGFAHAFLVLSESATFFYKCTNFYRPEYDSGIIYSDPGIKIDWPDIDGGLILSDKDKELKTLAELKFEYKGE